MSLFLVIAFSIYTLMHAVVVWGIRPLLLGHRAAAPLVWAVMLFFGLSPLAMRFLERAGHHALARTLAWLGFTWMGFLFLAFSCFVLLGAITLLFFGAGKVLPALGGFTPYGPQASVAVLLLVTAAGLQGMYSAHDLRIERVALQTQKLPKGRTVRVAQVTDVHLGLMSRDEVLAPIVAAVEGLKPDLLVATGDMVDAEISVLNGLSQIWKRLTPPLGKLAIMGNHEHYAGLAESRKFLEESGFTVLVDEGVVVGDIFCAGVDDNSRADEATLLGKSGGRFTLFLKHRPLVSEKSKGLFDLMLSGHTHGGQIFPFRLLTATQFPMYRGMFELVGGGRLYVSRGTGTWGPPMRVGAPPEITLFEITGI